MKTIPLLMTVNELDGKAEVWFEPSGAIHTELLADDPDYRISEGDWVVLMARVHKVKRTGGYKRGQPPPGGNLPFPIPLEPDDVHRHEQFQLDIAEVYLGMGIPTDEIKTHTRTVRRKRGMAGRGVQQREPLSNSGGNTGPSDNSGANKSRAAGEEPRTNPKQGGKTK